MEHGMSKQDEYRQYANEAIESARIATSEAVRKQFLDLAKMWLTAAQQMDDGIAPHFNGDDTILSKSR
jgi:hypothetical protein